MSLATPSQTDQSSNGGLSPVVTPKKVKLTDKTLSQSMDKAYLALLFLASLTILAIVIGLFVQLIISSSPSFKAYGFGFFVKDDWDPVKNVFAARPFILSTLYSSLIALLISVPISLGTAIFLSEISPRWLRTPLSFLVELLAAVPSVVYGLWAIFVMIPLVVKYIETPISVAHWIVKIPIWKNHLQWVTVRNLYLSKSPFFDMPPNGTDMLAAGLVLAIMVTPYITAVSRDILKAIPRSVREGSYALGSTKWEAINLVVLPFARAGITGGVILGLGRALGETMAVTMVCGNGTGAFKLSLFNQCSTMASVIANELGDASGPHLSALIEIGFVLFLTTMLVNTAARLLIFFTAKDIQGGGKKL
jgi:phosphate transport system permease protein